MPGGECKKFRFVQEFDKKNVTHCLLQQIVHFNRKMFDLKPQAKVTKVDFGFLPTRYQIGISVTLAKCFKQIST